MADELTEARDMARLLWHWALWLDHQMKAAFAVTSIEELTDLQWQKSAVQKYTLWDAVREEIASGYPWLKERAG